MGQANGKFETQYPEKHRPVLHSVRRQLLAQTDTRLPCRQVAKKLTAARSSGNHTWCFSQQQLIESKFPAFAALAAEKKLSNGKDGSGRILSTGNSVLVS